MENSPKSADVFYKICKSAMSEERIIAVYTEDTNGFSVGFVDSLTKEEIRLSALSMFGDETGYEVIRLSNVRRIDWGSAYVNAVESIMSGFNSEKYSVKLSPMSKTKSLVSDTLNQAAKLHLVVSLIDEDEDTIASGYVEKVEKDAVTLKALDEYGVDDGICTILLDSICSMTCNSRGDRVLSFLSEKLKEHS